MTIAATVAKALGGAVRHGRGWSARCPVPGHGQGRGDRNASLSIADGDDGRLLVRCFAGCDSRDVLAELRRRGLIKHGCDLGWRPVPPPVRDPMLTADAERKRQFALQAWGETLPAAGTTVEAYLRHRGITLPVPPCLRFAAGLPHLPTGTRWPAMVARVEAADGAFLGIHRTYLAGAGRGKALDRRGPDGVDRGSTGRQGHQRSDFGDGMTDIAEQRDSGRDAAGEVIAASELFQDPLRRLVLASKDNPGAPFEPDALKMLAELRRTDKPRFEGTRAAFKRAGIRVTALDEALDEEDGNPTRRDTQATALVRLAIERAGLFHRADGTGFADIEVTGHRETWPVRSRGFRSWLARLFFDETGGAPNGEAMQAALGLIEARCQFGGDERPVFLRVGGHEGRIYLDLCDAAWGAVEIDADGWRVVSDPPVRFRRHSGMLPLPVPERGGSIADLRPFLNVAGDDAFALAVGWLMAALRDRGPFPAVVLSGEQGSAKSTFSAILRALVDPNAAPLRSLPREDRDLFIAATNGWVLAFDNVSGLPAWISDTLCRLATGGGFATRQLYSDQDEVLFDAQRPVILNGIEDFVARPDLADRALLLTLEAIPDERRQPEKALWATFERARPRILGALLDAVAHGLKRLPNTKLARLPRMADFALWATACEGAYWPAGTFMAAYDGNRSEAVEIAIDGDAVAREVRELVARMNFWGGTAKDLLGALNDQAGEKATRAKEWPQTAKALSGRLRRAAPVLRKAGVGVRLGHRTERGYTITISAADNGGQQRSGSSGCTSGGENSSVSEGLPDERCLNVGPSGCTSPPRDVHPRRPRPPMFRT